MAESTFFSGSAQAAEKLGASGDLLAEREVEGSSQGTTVASVAGKRGFQKPSPAMGVSGRDQGCRLAAGSVAVKD